MDPRDSVIRDFCKAIFMSLLVGLVWSMTAALVVILLAHNAQAAEVDRLEKVEHAADVKQGSLLFRTQDGTLHSAPLLKTDVAMRITGMIARVTVTQHFTNPTSEWLEGVYVFPLPEESAVDHMKMHVGSREIEGQIKEREEAKQIYQAAKQEGKKASLIEQERPNIFTNSVANIGPNEKVSVEIEYQETLRYDQGSFRVRFPMVVAPRYIAGLPIHTAENSTGWAPNTDRVSDAARITPPIIHPSKGSINPVSIKIELDAGFPLEGVVSPYHAVDVRLDGDSRRTVTLRDDSVPANRDFELVWSPKAGAAPQAAVFTETKGDKTYALAMVLPPDVSHVPQKRQPREIIFIIDTSGSMAGESIRQSKDALILALNRLSTQDRFNVIEFNSTTRKLFDQVKPVTDDSRDEAKDFVRNLRADGGTEMAAALNAALDGSENKEIFRQVIFLTDGSVGNEDELFGIIHKKLGSSRLFTIGIGSAPNSHFMSKAAEFGHGTFTYIGKVEEVQEKMAALFAKLENPVLTDIGVKLPGAVGGEAWPGRVPDLYAGEPIVMTALLSDAKGDVVIDGRVEQAAWKTTLPLAIGKPGSGVSVLWARRKIGALMDSRQTGANAEEVRKAVLDLGLEHHLVTKYTSLVAVDVTPTKPADANVTTAALGTNLPAGWEHEKVFGGMPRTATPAQLQLLVGTVLLLLAALLLNRARRFESVIGQ